MSAHLTSNLHRGVDTGARSHQTLHPTTIPEGGREEPSATLDDSRQPGGVSPRPQRHGQAGRQGDVLALQRAGPLRQRASLPPPPAHQPPLRPALGPQRKGRERRVVPSIPQQLARQADKSVTDLPRGRSGPLSFSGRSRGAVRVPKAPDRHSLAVQSRLGTIWGPRNGAD